MTPNNNNNNVNINEYSNDENNNINVDEDKNTDITYKENDKAILNEINTEQEQSSLSVSTPSTPSSRWLPARRRPLRGAYHPEASRLGVIAGAAVRIVSPASLARPLPQRRGDGAG